jgi:transposase
MKEAAAQREHSLRAVFNAVRYLVRAGCPWRIFPNDLAPWSIVFCASASLDRGWVF